MNSIKVALFCNARDEKHIREWAAHHLLIGFNYIFIFDHNSVKPLSEVFKNFDKRVTIIPYNTPHNNIKLTLMNEAVPIARNVGVDWLLYLDADEFIVLNKFQGIKQLLLYYKFADSFALNWVMFGTNHLKHDPAGLILDSYTKSDKFLNPHVKSFVRVNEVVTADNPHYYRIQNPNKMCAINTVMREPFCFNDYNVEYNNVPAFIAHFVHQSEETYFSRKVKLTRDDTGQHREQLDLNSLHSLYNNVDNFAAKKYAANVQLFLEQYK